MSGYLIHDKKRYVIENSKYYNMRLICELAEINYDSFRSFKAGRQSLSELSLIKIIRAMSSLPKEIS